MESPGVETVLVYEQDDVYTVPTLQEELPVAGKLRIIERRNTAIVEWRCNDDEAGDSDWAVINTAAVSFTHHNATESVEITTPRRNVRPISLELVDLQSYKLGSDNTLILIQRDGTTHPALKFQTEKADFFIEVLQRYVAVKRSEFDPTLYLILNKRQAELDDQLSALNLVPERRGPRGLGGWPVGTAQWTPQRILGFFNNLKRDPYTTTLSTLSNFYDTILYNTAEGYETGSHEEDEVAELFSSLNGFEDLEPGYEILTKKGQLVERTAVSRLSPLTHDEFKQYVLSDGRISDEAALKQRIFQGGIHPNMRAELWCYLLRHYEWSSTFTEREEQKHRRKNEYFVIKQQWKTISQDQESRFMGFRERHSLIEKDVNRTDRNHPFFEKDKNPNVEILHDILMTYVMYNFDLGYVQGMSDLLAPILYVTQDESTAFWCFVGYMDLVYRNFDVDQSGMKQQLMDLQQLLRIADPGFMSYLEARDSANLYFCFRWLLVRFKRELSYSDTLRLWEVLWTGLPCPNFHLLIALAILDTERNTIVENKFGFTEILKHINDISLRIDLETTLKTAEAIYHQLRNSPCVPEPVRSIIGLPPAVVAQPNFR